MPPTSVTKRKRRSPGWIPDQHGAWAMLAVPLLLGVVMGGPAWVHLPLAVVWFVGYFAFFAAGLWLKSRRKPKYWPPVRAYALCAIPLGVLVLVLEPRLALWALPFAVLLGVSLWCSYRRRDRSLLNDTVTVVAGCLMLPVAYSASAFGRAAGVVDAQYVAGWSHVWAAFFLVLVYFLGTVLYVKTMIREKGSPTYLRASLAYHCLAVLVPVIVWMALNGGLSNWGACLLAVFFAGLVVRAWIMPRRGGTPKQVGMGEIVASVVLTALIWWLLA